MSPARDLHVRERARHPIPNRQNAVSELTTPPPIVIRELGPTDAGVLQRVAPDVFDGPVDAALAAEFLSDPRHHLVVALESETVVGMASAVHYVHPDKPPELWVNEVGVADSHVRRGVATRLLRALFGVGRGLGCGEAWVLTDESNAPAKRLYGALGGRREEEHLVMYSFHLDDYR